jgi:hypothetical protein
VDLQQMIDRTRRLAGRGLTAQRIASMLSSTSVAVTSPGFSPIPAAN